MLFDRIFPCFSSAHSCRRGPIQCVVLFAWSVAHLCPLLRRALARCWFFSVLFSAVSCVFWHVAFALNLTPPFSKQLGHSVFALKFNPCSSGAGLGVRSFGLGWGGFGVPSLYQVRRSWFAYLVRQSWSANLVRIPGANPGHVPRELVFNIPRLEHKGPSKLCFPFLM